jgi:hypothetical protein
VLLSQKTGGQANLTGELKRAVPDLLAAIGEQWRLNISGVASPDGKMQELRAKTEHKGIQISAPADIAVQ